MDSHPPSSGMHRQIRRARLHDGPSSAREHVAARFGAFSREVVRGQVPRELRRTCDSEDLAQEVALKAVRSLHQFEERGPRSWRSWLRTLSRRHLIDRWRAVRGRPAPVELEPWTPATGRSAGAQGDARTPSEILMRREERDALDLEIERLGPRHRAVFERCCAGETFVNIAADLSLPSRKTAARLYHEALIQLSRHLPDVR